jgi:hypothetical protein
VVMWPPTELPSKDDIGPPSGRALPTLCLSHYALAAPGGLASLLETMPDFPFRCGAPGEHEAILGLVDAAGDQRLRDKAAAMEGELSVVAADEVLYRAVMAALGFSRNTMAFVRLAENVPFSLLAAIAVAQKATDRPLVLEAFLLGKAGLLPCHLERAAIDDETSRNLQTRWNQLAGWDDGGQIKISWQLGRVRPANHPARRLAGAASLFAIATATGLSRTLLAPFSGNDAAATCRSLEQALMMSAPRTGDPAANVMRTGGTHPLAGFGPALIGRARAAEIVANAILPFALAYGAASGDSRLIRRALEVFAVYPAPGGNELGRYMADLLFRQQHPANVRTIRRQQGLLHLYKQWCHDKSCWDCPVGRPVAKLSQAMGYQCAIE